MLLLYYLFALVIGACIGSFLNVCISRLPYEKSLLWPKGSRCFTCLMPLRKLDNIPLFSYWLLGGRCRHCGARFSMRYFWVELLTAAGFVFIFHWEVVENRLRFAFIDPIGVRAGLVPWEQVLPILLHHWTLFSLLVVVALCDLELREIPLSVTLFGTFAGLASATLLPWPWPYTIEQVTAGIPRDLEWWLMPLQRMPKLGLYPWPIWWPLPAWLEPGTWQLGLATGLCGMLAGTVLLRIIRFLFNQGLGKAYLESRGGDALGLGDADMMMMAGAFLGWQPVIVAFFMAIFPGLLMALGQLILYRSAALPFGPALACGVVLTWLNWPWLGAQLMPLFFNEMLLILLAVAAVLILLLASLLLRGARYIRKEKMASGTIGKGS